MKPILGETLGVILFQEQVLRSAIAIAGAPGTAKGHVFLTLEDEEGLLNLVPKPHVYQKYRYIVKTEPLIAVEGVLQKREGIANIVAERVTALRQERECQQVLYPPPAPKARSFC